MKQKNESLFNNLTLNLSNLCGIDEAGRGPIAGPLVVAGVVLHKEIKELNDSKKLSVKKREELYEKIKQNSTYFIYKVEASKIDKIGLSSSLKEALIAIKKYFGDIDYIFDGNSSFGVDKINTLVKADSKIKAVSAASILAKVYRDNIMINEAKNYPQYGFEKHKGYGTKAHIEAIAKYGYCKIHRQSFKINLPNKNLTLF